MWAMTGLIDIASIDEVTAATGDLTMPQRFVRIARSNPSVPALHSMNDDGGWDVWTYEQYAEHVARAAAGLRDAGLRQDQRLLLMMRNRPDFHWFDSAAQFLRATPVSIYNSSSPEEIQYLAEHAEAEMAVVEDEGFLDRILKVRDELPMLRSIYVLHPPEGPLPDGVHPASELMDVTGLDLDEAASATDPDDLATLIYTSGTTGPPKGVMLSQYNVSYVIELLVRSMPVGDLVGRRVVSYLPMAHIAERAMSHYSGLGVGYSVYCCPDPNQLTMYLKEMHPEIFLGVPRVWEKIYNGVNAALGADPERKAKFDEGVAAALAIQRAAFGREYTDEERQTLDFLDGVAFANVRSLVGLDAVEVAITGAAPIPASVLDWFRAIGVPLSEIYGMSESTGPMTWSPERNKSGWVGRACHGMEVRLADDGEVCCRGGNVFQGYLKQPDKTAETIIDGWLHSGDIGEIDDEGYLRIVDRKKELIITAGGKNVSPANLEAALKLVPLVGQACAIGDQRPFVSALVVLDPDAAAAWAAGHGLEGEDATLPALAENPEVIAEIEAGVAEVMSEFNNAESVKKVKVLGEEWLPDTELLTPTSKLKRRGIHTHFAEEIDSLYAK